MVTTRSRVPGTRLLACTAATLILLGPATAGSRAQSAPDGAAPAQTQAPEPEAATPTVDGKPVAWWIEQLGADDFATREKATATLAKAGKDALPLLEKAAHSPDPEVRWRAQKALASVRKLLPGYAMLVRGGRVAREWCHYDLPYG
ncbi:MAG: HEAT repeat domain-containing protein, partial [Planctomycetota bacterium]